MNVQEIIGEYVNFLDLVFKNLSEAQIEVALFDLDHIAYRAISTESYFEISNKLSGVISLANRKIIRNRNVDMYLFNTPLIYRDQSIKFLEVMAPADGDTFKEGLEHAEFVRKDLNLHEFVRKYGGLTWNTNSIDREIGADVGLIFKNGANAKFKNQTMAEIIEQEDKIKKLVELQGCGLDVV